MKFCRVRSFCKVFEKVKIPNTCQVLPSTRSSMSESFEKLSFFGIIFEPEPVGLSLADAVKIPLLHVALPGKERLQHPSLPSGLRMEKLECLAEATQLSNVFLYCCRGRLNVGIPRLWVKFVS